MVEAVLWLPIFLVIFGLMVDSALVFHGQSKVLRVVQDANRNMSIGRLDTEDDVETYITTRLAVYGITPSTATAVTDATTGLVTTTVVVSNSSVISFIRLSIVMEVLGSRPELGSSQKR